MNKSERLLQLLTLLRCKRTAITAKALAEQLAVSERTVYRDIQSLHESGVDVQGEAGVGYMLPADSAIPPLMFNEQELESLMLGIRMVKAWTDGELGQGADSALAKIKAVLPDKTLLSQDRKRTKYVVPDFYRVSRVKHSETIRHAIDQLRCLEVDYSDASGKPSTRVIQPLGLVFWGSVWTLVAWCQLRDDYRMFRLDRLRAARLSEQSFSLRDDCNFEHYLKQWDDSATTEFW